MWGKASDMDEAALPSEKEFTQIQLNGADAAAILSRLAVATRGLESQLGARVRPAPFPIDPMVSNEDRSAAILCRALGNASSREKLDG